MNIDAQKNAVIAFLLNGDYKLLMHVFAKAKCSNCDGTGETDDAGLEDTHFKTWACKECDGQGWNRQSVIEIVNAVPDFAFANQVKKDTQ